MIDINKAQTEFDHYLDGFDRNNDKIRLKIIHTNEVVRCAKEIARRMNLSQEDRELAEVIALLHDIGRFEQVKRYDSFEQATMDHAAFGVELLFESDKPWIRSFVPSDQWDSIIREAIGQHSKYELGIIEDERTLLHARLIRDADKLDNCRVKLVDDMKVLLGMDAEEVGSQPITDIVFQTCTDHKSVRLADRITKMDYWVSYIAYFFDINFKETFQIIKENDFVNRLIDRVPYSNPDTRDKMEQIRKMVNSYIDDVLMSPRYIDLHLHLDGAITVDIARKLASMQDIQIPEDDRELEKMLTVSSDCKNLDDFLKCFELSQKLLQTEEGLTEAVRLVANKIRSQGVIYAEIRFAPQKHTLQGLSQEESIKAVLKGLEKTDLKANLILCCMRGEGREMDDEKARSLVEANEETLRLAKKYLVEDGGVVGIDLAGAEALSPTENFKDLFLKAKAMGIPFTIHAGEAAGADSVRAAVEFGASRIGHGVRSYEDPDLLNLLKEKGIILEMCPNSNLLTCVVKDISEHPLMDYLNKGLRVTINTDDMGIEGTTLAKEFQCIRQAFDLTLHQEKLIQKNAIDGAFTNEETKVWLRKELGIE